MPKRSLEILFFTWVILALLLLLPLTVTLRGVFPVFTLIFLLVPLLLTVRSGDPARVGFRPIAWKAFFQTTAITLGLWLLVMLLIEPWTGIYRDLLRAAVSAPTPDTTFAWLVRYPSLPGLLSMAIYTALVSIFAEELFFRGWLLQALMRRMPMGWAVALQGLLFCIPQGLAAFLFPPLQAVLWVVFYAWLAAGVIGGWAAARTGSIWPSLASAVLANLLLTAVLL